MTEGGDEAASATPTADRIALLERRVQRVAAERNRAASAYSRLATAVEPLAGQPAATLRKWFSGATLFEIERLQSGISRAMGSDDRHSLQAQILRDSEALSHAIVAGESGEDLSKRARALIAKFERLV